MDQVIFIPADKAGIFAEFVQGLARIQLKRQRLAEFRRLERVLSGLKLIPSSAAAFSIGWGVNHLGEAGVLVALVPSLRAIVQTPEAS